MPFEDLTPKSARLLKQYARQRYGQMARTSMPGSEGVLGGVLTGVQAVASGQAAYAQGVQMFGARGMPISGLGNVMRQRLSTATTTAYRETPFGGQIGLQAKKTGETLWLPTQYGPFMVMEGPQGEAVMKVTGVKGKLTVTQQLAEHFRNITTTEVMSIRQARAAINRQLRTMSPIVQAATGGTSDFLAASQTLLPGLASTFNDPSSFQFPNGMPNIKARLDAITRGIQEAQGLGFSAIYGKPERMLKGVFPALQPSFFTPFHDFLDPGRQLYQTIAFSDIAPGAAEALEVRAFGRRMPRLVTSGMRGVRLGAIGRGRQQEVMGNIRVVDPYSQLGTALREGGMVEGTEAAFVSEHFAATRFAGATRGAGTQRVGLGTALSMFGQKFNVAGIAPRSLLGGADALIVADMAKSRAHFLEYMLGDVLAQAVRLEKSGRLSKNFIRDFKKTGLGTLEYDTANSMAMLQPSPKLSSMGMGQVYGRIRSFALRQGLHEPFQESRARMGVLMGASRMGVGPIRIRGNAAVSNKRGMAMDPLNFMGMGSLGDASSEISQKMLKWTSRHKMGGKLSRATFAFFSPFVGREYLDSALGKFASLTPGQLPTGIAAQLTNVRTIQDVADLLANGLPTKGIRLKLPGAMHFPTPELFEKFGDRLGSVWGSVRTAGVARSELVLPPLEPLVRRIQKLSATELAEVGMDPTYLPDFVGAYGRVLGAAQTYASTPTKANLLALERTVGINSDSLFATLSGHAGKGRLLSRMLQPRIAKGIYATIQTGGLASQIAAKGGSKALAAQMVSLPGVGVREVGISARMAKDLGLSQGLIKRIQSGRKFYVGGQFYPSVVPETSGVFRLKILDLPRSARGVIVTNVGDRLAAFRDLDWDKMRLFLFPKRITQVSLRKAWREGADRIAEIMTEVQSAAAARNVSVDDMLVKSLTTRKRLLSKGGAKMGSAEVMQLMGQKSFTPLYHNTVRPLQAIAAELYGPGKSVRAMRALGVAYQMIIKKGRTHVDDELIRAIRGVGAEGDLLPAQSRIKRILGRLSTEGAEADIFMGIAGHEGEVAEQLANVGRRWAGLSDLERKGLRRMIQKEAPGAAEFLTLLHEERLGAATLAPDVHQRRMMKMGKTTVSTGALYQENLEAINRASGAMGEVGAAGGGVMGKSQRFWSSHPRLASAAAATGAAIGTLLGLRIAKSWLIGDEPTVGPGMNISPEVAARWALWPNQGQGGAPTPPAPMVEPGIHASTGQAQVHFSPPTARIVSPLQRNPRVSVSATSSSSASGPQIAEAVMNTVGPIQGPSLVGVMSQDAGGQKSFVDSHVHDMHHRESRFYA